MKISVSIKIKLEKNVLSRQYFCMNLIYFLLKSMSVNFSNIELLIGKHIWDVLEELL